MDFPILTTDRLRLRRLSHADADAIIAIYGDERVLQYLDDPAITTPEKAIALIDHFNSLFEEKGELIWGISMRDDDTLIGTCDLYEWNRRHRFINLGYILHPSVWGKGIATEVSREMIRWAFANLDIHRIQADITEGNLASENVLLKCGFTVEGVWRESCWEHERFVNIKQFGLLRREFEAQYS
jgi:ribosomal-protein-alanine N-acetyltransferase